MLYQYLCVDKDKAYKLLRYTMAYVLLNTSSSLTLNLINLYSGFEPTTLKIGNRELFHYTTSALHTINIPP